MNPAWMTKRLGEVIELKRGYDLPQQARVAGNVPIISSIGHTGSHNVAMVRAPGVVTGRYGTLGQVFLINEDFWPLNTTLYVRDFKGNDPRFVSYLLRTVDFHSCSDKAAVPGVNRNHLHELSVAVPDLNVQRAIAEVLGALDQKLELNHRMARTLEEMARALFKSWFVDFDPVRMKKERGAHAVAHAEGVAVFPADFEESEIGAIPKGWSVGPVTGLQADKKYACVAGPFGSNLTTKDYVSSGVPVIRGSNLASDTLWLQEEDFVFVSEEKADSLEGNLAFPGDVVFTQRGTLGQVVIIPADTRYPRFVISQSQMKLSVDSEAGSPAFVALYFRQPRIIDFIVANGQHAGVPHVNLGFLRSFAILLPSAGVLRAFETIVGIWLRRALAKRRESQVLGKLRDALLPKLLSGELRIPEAERIVAEAV